MLQVILRLLSRYPAFLPTPIMQNLTLPSGAQMPIVGYGTWQSKPGEVVEAVKAAIDAGYRHIDCAYAYSNEGEVGKGICAKIADGTVKREDLFIATKIWNTRHQPSDVRFSLEEGLKSLGLDYVDLYLIHWPHSFKSGREDQFPRDEAGNLIYDDVDYLDTYHAMEALVRDGLTRDLGLSNFNSRQIQRVLDNCTVKPAVHQVEIHPYFPNTKLVEFCQARGIHLTAYSPLGSGDRPWAKSGEPDLLGDPRLQTLGGKYNKSPAQVILQWLVSRGISVIPKSVTPSRIKENLEVLDFKLTAEDQAVLNKFDMGPQGRIVVPYIHVDGKRVFRDREAKHFPFHIEF